MPGNPEISISRPSLSEIESLVQKISRIYEDIKSAYKDPEKFIDVLFHGEHFTSMDLAIEQKPETFTIERVVRPLLDFLGYSMIGETTLRTPSGRRIPDFTITAPRSPTVKLYVEVEPINTPLYQERKGRGQVQQWLISKASETEYGIASDGLIWNLVRFDEESAMIVDVLTVYLHDIFKAVSTGSRIEDPIVGLCSEFLNLASSRIPDFLMGHILETTEKKEDITEEFYGKYVRYVFGVDEDRQPTREISLIDSVRPPTSVGRSERALFSVVTMNRLMFISFLEDKELVNKQLLQGLYTQYENGTYYDSFYKAILKVLFFEVFNKNPRDRNPRVRSDFILGPLPYLNGGLFRTVLPDEEKYDIDNDALKIIIFDLLGKYSIGVSDAAVIKPEILGYIFEKTINDISVSENKQKSLGAYYTPDDVVKFILRNTLDTKIDEIIREGMSERHDQALRNVKSLGEFIRGINEGRIDRKTAMSVVTRIDSIRIIDPACGSGHFLSATLNDLTRIIASIFIALDQEFSLYDIKQKILAYNIYGVEIDPNGAEITRLRLWLSLIGEIRRDSSEQMKTLPNIDFNIVRGNSLIGIYDEPVNVPLEKLDLELDDVDTPMYQISRITGQDVSGIWELIRSAKRSNVTDAYERLINIYRGLSGEVALSVRGLMVDIRRTLYNLMDHDYLNYVKVATINGDIDISPSDLRDRHALHWPIDFHNVVRSGGFDVVIGNPPYIEDRDYDSIDLQIVKSMGKRGREKVPAFYASRDSGNTHAYFIERSLKILKENGRFGFIVPISLVSTNRMASIRAVIHSKSGEVSYYDFDDRPGKIFSGIEDCRSTIVITRRGNGVNRVTTSKYHRWYSRNRPALFDDLRTTTYHLDSRTELIPKLGSQIELSILQKIRSQASGKTLGTFQANGGRKVWYHNAPQYWIHAHFDEYVPRVEYYNDFKREGPAGKITLDGKPYETKITDQYKPLEFSETIAPVVAAILNSSLAYWWFVIYSDGRHLLSETVMSIPIDLETIPEESAEKISAKSLELMKDFDRNSNIKTNVRKGGYAIKIKEIIPKKSLSIISEIDDLIAEAFSLTREEAEFIRNFDIGFRMGVEAKEE